jgi:hypothetical protein
MERTLAAWGRLYHVHAPAYAQACLPAPCRACWYLAVACGYMTLPYFMQQIVTSHPLVHPIVNVLPELCSLPAWGCTVQLVLQTLSTAAVLALYTSPHFSMPLHVAIARTLLWFTVSVTCTQAVTRLLSKQQAAGTAAQGVARGGQRARCSVDDACSADGTSDALDSQPHTRSKQVQDVEPDAEEAGQAQPACVLPSGPAASWVGAVVTSKPSHTPIHTTGALFRVRATPPDTPRWC